MESLQCLEDLPDDVTVTQDICFPSTNRIISDLRVIIKRTGINNVFIGSDTEPPLTELKEELGPNVSYYRFTFYTSNYNYNYYNYKL